MKKHSTLVVALVLLLAGPAKAVIIDLGVWTPPPGGESATDELAFLNLTVIPTYNSTHNPDLVAATVGTQNIDTPTSPTSITLNLTGYEYLKLKWDGMWQFYYVAGSGTETFNSTVFNANNQPQGLSHYTLYNSVDSPGGPGAGVPDGGISVAMLGLALFSLELFRRAH